MTLPVPPRYVVLPHEVIEQAYAGEKPKRALLASFTRIISLAWEAKYQKTPALNETELMEFLKLSRRQYYEQKAEMEADGWLRSSHPRPGFVQFDFSRSTLPHPVPLPMGESVSAENRTAGAKNRTGELRIEEEDLIKLLNTKSESSSSKQGEVRKTALEETDVRKSAPATNDKASKQMITRMISNLYLLFDPMQYGLLNVRPEFLENDQNDVLAWITSAYNDRERLVRGGGVIGFIVAKLAKSRGGEEFPHPYFVENYAKILPDGYLEKLGLVEFECTYCTETFGTRAERDAHEQAEHPYRCLECSAVFRTEADERAHYEQEHHPDRLYLSRGDVANAAPALQADTTEGKAWATVLGQLQQDMAKASFDTWARDTRALRYDGNTLVIGARSVYARDWLESRLTSTVEKMLVGVLNQSVQVEFVVAAEVEA